MRHCLTKFGGIGLLAIAPAFSSSAGPITPPAGPVASTPKPLAEIEPRVAINAANTPGDNDATPSIFKIVESGSYYLTENLRGEFGKSGIEITAPDGTVTIDLNGFTLDGESSDGTGSGSYGIIADISTSVAVSNGFVINWEQNGISLHGLRGSRIEHVTVRGNLFRGIHATDAVIIACIAEENLHGFVIDRSVLQSCVANSNTQNGVFSEGSGVIRDCHIERNELWGISHQSGGTLQIEGNAILFNSAGAITACAGARIVNNNIRGLGEEDIAIEGRCGSNLVDSNRISDCELGIDMDNAGSPGDTIIRNVFQNVAAPFAIDVNDDVGPVTTAAAATNPFSNLQK